MENLFNHLEQVVLRMDSRFCTEDGHLLKNNVVEAALALDPKLLHYLLADEKLKKQFFSEVDGLLVFDKVKFQRFVMNKQFLPDSYTAFKNKVGLTNENGEFLSESREVVLSWPYKDCMLEGGQTKEDAKRQEIFWNETLAPDEINRLTEPKALCHFRRYDSKGEHEATELRPDDNLIIKGNNLLALYSLRERFRNSVKLIYIDPPYYFSANKGEDTFLYNSNFKLSTWLTFMRNRLEIARDLLSDDGAIFVQISDDGVGELHCLLKQVFNVGENNFINKITVKTKSPSGFASVNPGVFETAEYILAFAKHKRLWKYNQQFVKSDYDDNYKWFIIDKSKIIEDWEIVDVFEYVAKLNGFKDKKEAIQQLGIEMLKSKVAIFALQHSEQIFRYTAIGKNAGQDVVTLQKKSKETPKSIYKLERENHYDVYIQNGQELAFYSKKIRLVDGENVPSMQLSNIWNDVPYEGIAKEGDVTLKGGKKPEKLIKRIIEMATNQNDVVLDFHLGSGTTAAVAMKLNRRFIGIEQLNYLENDSVVRLQNVIKGDPTGISKSVGWNPQNPGLLDGDKYEHNSFVYCELAQANQQLVEEIMAATEPFKLQEIWQQLQEKGFLSYKVSPKIFNEHAEDFNDLSLDGQKRFLIECLDKNMLYIPLADIDDTHFTLTENDKLLTRQFYARR